MAIQVDIPGRAPLQLEHLLLDQNGTLTDRGALIGGVADRLTRVGEHLALHVLTADTFGTLDALTHELGVEGHRVSTGAEKLTFLNALGSERCAAIGNGKNDVLMLTAAAVGIAVIGPEGASSSAIAGADLVCKSIVDALELLLDERVLIATLRA
ncbi:MAG TPA: HAD hydrolase family protein [Solirubrobacteraceae bacterium]|nr:HAD hydrolase family protein [Solirubrobacteraceae bacterium]